jgi:hypothetical protein
LSLLSLIDGSFCTGVGAGTLLVNTADHNTATGAGGLLSNTTGDNNTADGFENTAVGNSALLGSTGDNNIAVGFVAGLNVTTANNVIAIGHYGADVSNTTWIGNVYGVTTQNGTTAPVIVSDTVSSSRRFKKEIKPMDQTSQAIPGLKPVTLYDRNDGKGTPLFGSFVAAVNGIIRDL